MSGEIYTTIVGGLAEAPEMRFTPSGVPVLKMSVANSPRTFNRDKNEWEEGAPTWVNVTAWRQLAENIAGSNLAKGDRVVCYGTLENRKYANREGETRYSLDMQAIAVGPDLTWVTAKLGDGVHEGAKARKQRPAKEDQFESASRERPQGASGKPATAQTEAAKLPPQSDTPPSDDW